MLCLILKQYLSGKRGYEYRKFFKDIVARTSASIWMKTEIRVKIIYIFLLNYDIFVILHIARDLKPLALQL